MKYELVIPTSLEKIVEVEKKLNFTFPEDFRKDIFSFNGGYPTSNLFMVGNVERVFNCFCSMNEEDENYIVDRTHNVDPDYHPEKYIFFADDPFGNLIGFNRLDNAIYFFNHEAMENEYTKVAVSWTEFKSMLYKDTN